MSSIGYDASVKGNFEYQDLKNLVMDSTYNRGELRLNSKGELETVNSHVSMTWKNHEVTSREENARVRSAVYNSIESRLTGSTGGPKDAVQKFLKVVRQTLFADGAAGESLSRDEVRYLLHNISHPRIFADIPLIYRKIRAVKQGENGYGENQGERENFLHDHIKGYDVSTRKNDVILGVTDNMRSDKAWRQSLETAKQIAARKIDRCSDLSEAAKTVLKNHVHLELEETWSHARSAQELLDSAAVKGMVETARRDGHFNQVLSAVTELAKDNPVTFGLLLRSGIDLLTAFRPGMDKPKEYFCYLAHSLGCLVPYAEQADPYDLCDKLLKRAGEKGVAELNGADPSTMTRSKLLETCVRLLWVKSVDDFLADTTPLTVDGMVQACQAAGKGSVQLLQDALNSDEGKTFLGVLNDGALAFGMNEAPKYVAILLRRLVGVIPPDLGPDQQTRELKNILKELAYGWLSSKPDKLHDSMTSFSTHNNLVEMFQILQHDKFRVETDLTEMKTFLSKQLGEGWEQANTGLSSYMKALETEAKKKNALGSVCFEMFTLHNPKHAERLLAPVLKFKLERLKQVVLARKDAASERPGEDAVRIVEGKNLSGDEKEILQAANGKALLEALELYEVGKGMINALSYPANLMSDKQEQLKRILLPTACKVFQDGRSIRNFADLRNAWAAAFGKPEADRYSSPAFSTWSFEYLSFLNVEQGADEWKQIVDFAVAADIDLQAVDMSPIAATNSNLAGPFLLAMLSREHSDLLNTFLTAAKHVDQSPAEGLSMMIRAIGKVKPEDLGLEIASEEDRKLFDSLKWMIPQDCLNLSGARPHELANRSIVRIFRELTATATELAETSQAGRDPQEIAEFRQNLMEKVSGKLSVWTLFVAVRNHLADEAESGKAAKFAMVGRLKAEYGNLMKKQAEVEALVMKFVRKYGFLLPGLDQRAIRDHVLNLMDGGADILDRNQNFDMEGKVKLLEKGATFLERRMKILDRTLKLANQPKYAEDQDLIQATARIVAMSDRTACVGETSAETVLDVLKDWARNPQVKTLSARLREQMSGMPDTKNEVAQTLGDVFSAAAPILESLLSGENANQIFKNNGKALGPDDVAGLTSAFLVEMLNVDRNLICQMAAAKADADLAVAFDDIRARFMQEHKGVSIAVTSVTARMEDLVATNVLGGGESADRMMEFIQTNAKPGEKGKCHVAFAEFLDQVGQSFEKEGLAAGEDRTAVRAWIVKQLASVADDANLSANLAAKLTSSADLMVEYGALLRLAKRCDEDLAALRRDHPEGLKPFTLPSQPTLADLKANPEPWKFRLKFWNDELRSMLAEIAKLNDADLGKRLTRVLLHGEPLSGLNEAEAGQFRSLMRKVRETLLSDQLKPSAANVTDDILAYGDFIPPGFTDKGKAAFKTLVLRLWDGRIGSFEEHRVVKRALDSLLPKLKAFANGLGEDLLAQLAESGFDFKALTLPEEFERFDEYGLFLANIFNRDIIGKDQIGRVLQNPLLMPDPKVLSSFKLDDYYPLEAGARLAIDENLFNRLKLVLWTNPSRLGDDFKTLCLAVRKLKNDQAWKQRLYANESNVLDVYLRKILLNRIGQTNDFLHALDEGVDSFVAKVKVGFEKRSEVREFLNGKYKGHVDKCLRYMGLDPVRDEDRWDIEKKAFYSGKDGNELPQDAFGWDMTSEKQCPYLDAFDTGEALKKKIGDRIDKYGTMMDNFAAYLDQENFDLEVKAAARRMIATSQHDRFPDLETAKTFVQSLQALRNDPTLAGKLRELANENPKNPQGTFDLFVLVSEKCADIMNKLPKTSFDGVEKQKKLMMDLVWSALASYPDLALQFGDRSLNAEHFEQLRPLEAADQATHEGDPLRAICVGAVFALVTAKGPELTALYNDLKGAQIQV